MNSMNSEAEACKRRRQIDDELDVKRRRQLDEDLTAFVHRVALNENASPAEIAALPEIAKVLFTQMEFRV